MSLENPVAIWQSRPKWKGLKRAFIQTTHIKDLKAGDVQDPDEVLSGLLGVQLLVDAGDHPQKHLLVDGLGQSTHCIVHLRGQSSDCWRY